jgi:DNA-binding MarR family transcriptional regulator
MAQIAAAPDDTQGALAERTGLDQSTLSRNLRGLELAGLVEIAIADADQRRRAVWLTEQGARRLQAAIPVWQDAHGELAKRMDPGIALRLGTVTEQLVGK